MGPRGSQRNDVFDVFEYIGQSPICDEEKETPPPKCHSTEGMALFLDVAALSSKLTYLGAPDAYTEGAMDNDWLKMIVDYVRVWY